LVRIYDGEKLVAAEIIDYKTDDITKSGSKSLKNKVDYYGPQVAAYRRAVASMTGLDSAKISAKLLFVGLGIVQEISP
jgi:ATP-dependent helicase/nuclease subunit A